MPSVPTVLIVVCIDGIPISRITIAVTSAIAITITVPGTMIVLFPLPSLLLLLILLL